MKKPIECCMAGLIAITLLTAAQAQAPVKTETKMYLAQDEGARRVLENMLAMFGRKLVSDGMPNQPVSGRFEARSIEEVMSYFKGAFQINWYQNGVHVYVYNSDDWRTKRIYVGGERTNDDWKDLLKSAGLLYKDFPFALQSETKELVVSGPRSYLKLVDDAFGQKRPDPSEVEKHGLQLMVFPLRYASVEDRQTTLRGTVVTTPGVLSVLLNLLGLPNQPMTSAPESKRPGMNVDSRQSDQGLETKPRMNILPTGLPKTESADNGKQDKPLSVTADPRTNSILIRDAKSKHDYYKTLIDKLDRPVAMIEVEAMMVEVDQRGLNELGLEFGLRGNNVMYDFPGSEITNENLIPPGASSIVDPIRFMARLKALSADENAKVLARPTIVTQDNVPAYIDLSQTLYLSITGERVADVVPITAGSLLQVTPRVVSEDGEEKIFLRIEIQDGSISENVRSISNPSVQNTSLSTQALIHRERAILIGGYNREAVENKDYKIPVLGSLPFIGKVFSSEEKSTSTVARLFLISPRLIESPAHESDSTRKAVGTLQSNFPSQTNGLKVTPTLKIDSNLSR